MRPSADRIFRENAVKTWTLGILALFLGACAMTERAGTGTATASAAGGAGAPVPARSIDPSLYTWASIYCTADNESHIRTESINLGETNFAPPAPPLYIGGGGAATATFFGGFVPDWGAEDLEQKVYHAAPAVQWLTVLTGSIYLETSDGDSRAFRAGDVMHLADTAPCRGHITHNTSAEPVFVQFVR